MTLFAAADSYAADATWSGAENAVWANSANWSATPYPSEDDSARFEGDGNGNTVLDLTGLAGILNITFDGAGVASYALGAAPANSQTLVLRTFGEIAVTDSAGSSQAIQAAVQLGPDRAAGPYVIRNDSAGQSLTLQNIAAPASGGTAGQKTLTFRGAGDVTVLGDLQRGGATGLLVTNTCDGVLTLSGSNIITTLTVNRGSVDIGAGYLFLDNAGGNVFNAYTNTAITGTGRIRLSTNTGQNYADWFVAAGNTLTINPTIESNGGLEMWSGTGTYILNGANLFYSNVYFGAAATLCVSNIGNQGSATSNLGRGQRIILGGNGSRLVYWGPGETTDRILELNQNATVEHAGQGTLDFSSPLIVGGNVKTLTLSGSTAGTGILSGSVGPGTALTSLAKTGTKTWVLAGANSYAGATTVDSGTLVLAGPLGSISNVSDVTVQAGAAFVLLNTAAANNGNRLRDAGRVLLNGGTLAFSNDGSAASFAENAGAVVIGMGACTVQAAAATPGQTSALNLDLVKGGGTVNFVGAGLGDSDQNRIFLTGQSDGFLGLWATVNGTSYAAYSAARGVYAGDPLELTYTDIAARGPDSVIPDDAGGDVRINTSGDSGHITLQTSPVSSARTLWQSTETPAVVTTTSTTFRTSAVTINAGKASVTIGAAAGDGALTALTAGGALVLQNDSDSATLTVNAALPDNGSASDLAKAGPGLVRLSGPLSYTGATGLGDGTLAISGGSATQALAGAISGAGALVKEGTGRLTLSGNNSYTGLTTVSEGTLQVQSSTALGSTNSGTVVASGATLDLGSTLAAQALNLGGEAITAGGSGVNGVGAIINSSGSSQYNALRFVTLTEDTVFGGLTANGRWDIRNTATPAALAMNGYTITKTGPNYVGLTGVDVTPGTSGAIDIREGLFTVEAATTLGGSAANVMTVGGGAAFDIYNLAAPVAWSLVMEDNSRYSLRQGNATNLNIWAGPVQLNGRGVLVSTYGGGQMGTFSGDLSGTGSLVVMHTNSLTRLLSANNTYGGTTTISNGTLYARHAGSLPGYSEGRLTVVNGGTISVPAFNGAYGWTSEQLNGLHSTSLFTGPTAMLAIETFGNLDHPYNFPSPMGLVKQGNGVLRIPENQALVGQVRVNGYNSELVLNNLLINVTNNSCYLADAAADFARLTVSNGAAWSSYLAPDNVAGPSLYVGNNGRAVLTIDNASLTNRLIVGSAAGSHGAVYQRGAASYVHNWCGRASDARMGDHGYCYYELSDGTLTNNGHIQYGRYLDGIGILSQSGGRMLHGNPFQGDFQISRGGTGLVYIAGGTFASSANVSVGYASDNQASRGFAEFTLAPGAVSATVAGNVNVADRTNMLGVVNLNGGVLTANMISKGNRANNLAIVNFDGGTLRARTSGGNLINGGNNAPSFVHLYDGGATIDTDTNTVTIPVPLRAPAGNGVASIALAPRGGYIGPPFLTIAGGGGTGATAIATFDSASGTVTGATVTSPGFGYTDTPTVSLSGGGTNVQTAVLGVTLAPNVSGGLTKMGSGTLVLSSTNTYAGPTIVSNGTLRLALRQSLPEGGDVGVHGGTLDLGGNVVSAGVVTVSSGAISNGWLQGALTKVGEGTAVVSAASASAGPILVSGGTLQLAGRQPGLFEGRVAGNFNLTALNPMTATPLGTRYADLYYTSDCFINSGGIWTNNSTYIYSGFLWNNAGTDAVWTFSKTFDDSAQLKIDNVVVLYNQGSANTAITNYTLSPGPHAFELRLGQGTGAVGPGVAGWNGVNALGVGYDPYGRGQALRVNFQPLVDPGNGSLLTLSAQGASNPLDAGSAIDVAAGATLDLGGSVQSAAEFSGAGTVINGSLSVTGTLAPGGTNAVGTLSLPSTALAGKLLVDVGAGLSSDRVNVTGNFALGPAATLEVANPAALTRTSQYTLVSSTGSCEGRFAEVLVPDPRWHVLYLHNAIKLVYVDGTLLKLR